MEIEMASDGLDARRLTFGKCLSDNVDMQQF
jgi:hypothetical protein